MPGQLWGVPAEGGYLYSDELSSLLRLSLQPLCKFRQFCDAKDGAEKGLQRGETYNWNIFSDVGSQGYKLLETAPIPETNFTITRGTLTVTEWGRHIAP